jgi:hypothetical protein
LLERGNIRGLMGELDDARRDWQRVGQIAPGTGADMAARVNLENLAGKQRAPSMPRMESPP